MERTHPYDYRARILRRSNYDMANEAEDVAPNEEPATPKEIGIRATVGQVSELSNTDDFALRLTRS